MWHGSARVVFLSQAKPLDRQTFVYDFRETSSSTHQSVVKKVRKAEFNATTFDHSGDNQLLPCASFMLLSQELSLPCASFMLLSQELSSSHALFTTAKESSELLLCLLHVMARRIPVRQGVWRLQPDLFAAGNHVDLPVGLHCHGGPAAVQLPDQHLRPHAAALLRLPG